MSMFTVLVARHCAYIVLLIFNSCSVVPYYRWLNTLIDWWTQLLMWATNGEHGTMQLHI